MKDADRNPVSEPATLDSSTPISVAWFRGVIARASWTVIDQGLASFSNFAANLVLARWLTPDGFGGYMAASALFWLALCAHSGLLIEPMMVFGSSRFHDRPSSYLAVLTIFHWGVSAMMSVGLATAGLALMLCGSRTSGLSMLGYAVAAPVVLLLWLLRRSFYIWSHPRLAAIAGGVYMVGMVAILYTLYRSATLSSFTAPLASAGASILAIVTIIGMRRFPLWSPWRGNFMREVAAAHWRFGRWAALSGIISWAGGGLYYLIVPMLVGLEANAALNVLGNLIMPAVQLNLAAMLLLVPALSRARQDRRAASLMWKALLVLVAGASIYAVVVGVFGGPLIDLVYQGRYTQYAHLAWLMGLVVVPFAAGVAFGSALRALERPDRELSAAVVAVAVTCVGIAAIASWGLLGAILGLLASRLTAMIVALWWVLRLKGRPP
jgi:O-antigen/teichoic acid export membrane protein